MAVIVGGEGPKAKRGSKSSSYQDAYGEKPNSKTAAPRKNGRRVLAQRERKISDREKAIDAFGSRHPRITSRGVITGKPRPTLKEVQKKTAREEVPRDMQVERVGAKSKKLSDTKKADAIVAR